MRDYVRLLDWLRSSQNACYLYGCDECPADCENHEGDIFKDAADAIEELVAIAPQWHPASEQPERSDPRYARQDFIVRLESGHIMSLTYEFDNSDRCRDGCEPLFPVGWRKTARPVTHWMYMPKFDPPKEVV